MQKGKKTRADIGKEVAQLRDNMLYMMQKLQERDQIVDNALTAIVEKHKVKDIKEIEYTEEELFAKFKPLVNVYGVEKETGDIVKIISVVNDWTITEVKEPANDKENPRYIFKSKLTDEVREIYANGALQAWTLLRKSIMDIKKPALVETEEAPKPTMTIVK